MSTSQSEDTPVEAASTNPAIIHDLPDNLKQQGYHAVIRTQKGCFGLRSSPAWGQRLVPVADPVSMVIDEADFNRIELIPNFPRIPSDIWARVITLYFYFCNPNNKTVDSQTEVSVRFTRKRADPSIWRCWVPKQEVGGGSVHARFDEGMVDIVTGEKIEGPNWPPEDEFDAGSSHSHNTMSSFFSGTDDTNELPCPGLHTVVGNIDRTARKYTMLSSIVLDKKRFLVASSDVIDNAPVAVRFHERVLEVVSKYVYKSTYPTTSYSYKPDAPREIVVYDSSGARIGLNTADMSRVSEPYSKNALGTTTAGSSPVSPAAGAVEPDTTTKNGGTSSPADIKDVIASKISQSTITGQMRSAGKRVVILLKRMFSHPEGKVIAEGAIREVLGDTTK